MKILQRRGPGEVGLNYMWLPTWIGMNVALIKEIEEHLAPFLVGQPLTEEVLDRAGDVVIQYLTAKFPSIGGIFEYLDGLKYVEIDGKAQSGSSTQEGGTATPPS